MRNLIIATLLALATLCRIAQAQPASDWPQRPVRIIVPFTAGSFTTLAARALAKELSDDFQQPFIVENRVGAGGLIGISAVANATPDGYTLLFVENSFAIAPSVYQTLPYDPETDIVQIAQLAEVPAVLVARKDLPVRSLQELVELAKREPGILNFGSAGNGTSSHLGVEVFLQDAGIDVTHIPYKGISAATVDVLAGHVDLALGSLGIMYPYIQDGRVQGLALSGMQRHLLMPQLPTFHEQGYPEYAFTYWFGLMAPRGIPTDVIRRLEDAVMRAAQQAGLHETLNGAGVLPTVLGSTAFSTRVRQEKALWRKVVQQANLKPQ